MKKLIFLPILLLFVACSTPDKERIVGKWVFTEVYQDGKLVATTDVAQQEKLADEQLKKEEVMLAQMGIDKATAKKQVLDRMKKMSKSGFEFTKTEFFEFREGSDEKRKQEYKLDEAKKTITVLEKGKPIDAKDKVKYEFEGDNLVLKAEKIKMILVRKS